MDLGVYFDLKLAKSLLRKPHQAALDAACWGLALATKPSHDHHARVVVMAFEESSLKNKNNPITKTQNQHYKLYPNTLKPQLNPSNYLHSISLIFKTSYFQYHDIPFKSSFSPLSPLRYFKLVNPENH